MKDKIREIVSLCFDVNEKFHELNTGRYVTVSINYKLCILDINVFSNCGPTYYYIIFWDEENVIVKIEKIIKNLEMLAQDGDKWLLNGTWKKVKKRW